MKQCLTIQTTILNSNVLLIQHLPVLMVLRNRRIAPKGQNQAGVRVDVSICSTVYIYGGTNVTGYNHLSVLFVV